MAHSKTIFARLILVLAALPAVAAMLATADVRAQGAATTTDKLTQFEFSRGDWRADVTFRGADEREVTLSQYRGKVVVMNFWATWCAPCVKEMPSLDRAQALLGPQFKILALSVDAASSRPKVAAFYREKRLENLEIHFDIGRLAFQSLNILVLPTTIVFDAEGREVGRLQGEADWDSPQALALIRKAAEPSP